MSRKRKKEADTADSVVNAAIASPKDAEDAVTSPLATKAVELPPASERPLADPYRVIFTCSPKGFELGENYRFKQRVFTFKEKPDRNILQRLKDAGYVYRPQEKVWTIQADARTRFESDALAREIAGQALEAESSRDR